MEWKMATAATKKGYHWVLGSFIRREDEGARECNSGDGITKRCSEKLGAVTLAVVSSDQLLETAQWHCRVPNTGRSQNVRLLSLEA